jgi:hypothetical protein
MFTSYLIHLRRTWVSFSGPRLHSLLHRLVIVKLLLPKVFLERTKQIKKPDDATSELQDGWGKTGHPSAAASRLLCHS